MYQFAIIAAFMLLTSLKTASVPLANLKCLPWKSAAVLCIDHYSAVMTPPFRRHVSNNVLHEDSYGSTDVPADGSFGAISNASFLVFDYARGLEILGDQPLLSLEFRLDSGIHEAPVYVPRLKKLFVSQVGSDLLPLLSINLAQSPPTISNVMPSPPLYNPVGGFFQQGLIWYATAGTETFNGTQYPSGLYTFNPESGSTMPILNNYFGYKFNGLDDIVLDAVGDVWFTDNYYSFAAGASDTPPGISAATYRFRPSTGAVNVVEDSLQYPNGIAFSPDGTVLYLSDTGAESGLIDPRIPLPSRQISYNSTGVRSVYAYDVSVDGMSVKNKRTLYRTQDLIPDGLKVSRNGYIVVASGHGVDVIDSIGTLLVRVEAEHVVNNIQWVGDRAQTLWLVGNGGISRVDWALVGA